MDNIKALVERLQVLAEQQRCGMSPAAPFFIYRDVLDVLAALAPLAEPRSEPKDLLDARANYTFDELYHALTAKAGASERNDRRYRWLRSNHDDVVNGLLCDSNSAELRIDAAIDTALDAAGRVK